MGILCCVCCYGAKLGLGASIAYKLCLFYWYNVVKLNWYDLDYVWVSGAVFVCVKQCQSLQFSLKRARLA